jgi:hypothetical protein
VSGRASGIRHAIDYARRARAALAVGNIGAALIHWGHARCHAGFTAGLTEGSRTSAASALLRRSLLALGERLERAVAPRAKVPGWEVAGAVMDALLPLWDAFPEIGAAALADVAANAAATISRRYVVTERA